MLLYLYFVLAGCFCYSSADVANKTVPQNTEAILPCPHKKGDVTWSRYTNGGKVKLVTIKNGTGQKNYPRFGSLPDNSLVIIDVTSSDSSMYLCNQKKIYLVVTTDAPVTPRNDEPGQKGIATDTENQQPSDFWKVLVGVVVGAALVLLVILTLRFCSKNRLERNTNLDETVNEVIYEEIGAGVEQPGGESYFESPYYCTSISEMPSTSTPTSNNLYSTVNKLTAEGRSSEECVYSLTQNPLQTGNGSE
ncbi:uncharacterized protein LOC119485950 [Sebastes umbrosus]|uniref:uncharacterized protein LOC119485950 n=1 Tax=Sebastes umbrosus TaxID=72105 RepID=UPI00189E0048|nr:uncharacterized protein LOC119485950 [Sebastes umbrosus]